jgi:hypothetical protein
MSETKIEGPRGFAVLLQRIDDGELHEELSTTLQELTEKLTEHAERTESTAKGSITITLSLAAKANGTVSVEADVKTKEPKAKRPGSVFWVTDGNNLSSENPRQTRLPLREVAGNTKAREVEVVDLPARSV